MKGQKNHLNIAMNGWKQRLIVMNNRKAESYETNDQRSSGENNVIGMTMQSTTC